MIGKEYDTNQGKVVVVDYVNNRKVLIEFQDEFKHRKYVRKEHLLSGKVSNPFFKNKYGGSRGIECASSNPLYDRWRGMMWRCYNEKYESFPRYGGKGVTVCDEWHNFQNYARDISKMKNYENLLKRPNKWDVDKDILSGDSKIYSKETCIIISKSENSSIADRSVHQEKLSKPVKQLTLSGKLVENFNSAKEAETKTGIYQGNISQCVRGIRKSAGGYKWV